MNGYLMQEQQWIPGEDLFVESFSPENSYGVIFEDDGQAAYFYAVEKDKEGTGLRVLDALHIQETDMEKGIDGNLAEGKEQVDGQPAGTITKPNRLLIVWSRDWLKSALVIDGFCHALFDFEARGGYNINEFPPPNEFWTQGDRKLSDDLMRKLF